MKCFQLPALILMFVIILIFPIKHHFTHTVPGIVSPICDIRYSMVNTRRNSLRFKGKSSSAVFLFHLQTQPERVKSSPSLRSDYVGKLYDLSTERKQPRALLSSTLHQ